MLLQTFLASIWYITCWCNTKTEPGRSLEKLNYCEKINIEEKWQESAAMSFLTIFCIIYTWKKSIFGVLPDPAGSKYFIT